MTKKAEGKTILNKTRSSKDRWTHYENADGGELVNGQSRYKVTDFVKSDHPQKEEVLGWMAEKGIGVPEPTPETVAEPPTPEIVNKSTPPEPSAVDRNGLSDDGKLALSILDQQQCDKD